MTRPQPEPPSSASRIHVDLMPHANANRAGTLDPNTALPSRARVQQRGTATVGLLYGFFTYRCVSTREEPDLAGALLPLCWRGLRFESRWLDC